jgi:DNA-binding CsgD family transcriptional regulator/tetratricopeptide (TPR) repeat protein
VNQDVGLIERDRHLTALEGWFRDAVSGAGRMVFVGGEAGIGKSALLDRFSQLAHGQARALRGACDMLSTPRPLGPLLDIAMSVGGEFDRLANSGIERDQLFREIAGELSNGALPVIAIVEDAHWADEATIDLLRFLGRRLESWQVLILVSYRDDEIGPDHPLRILLGDLATAKTIKRLNLSPLSVDGIRSLIAASHLGTQVEPRLLHRLTGGNPFFASEVLADSSSANGTIPPTVRDAVLARASRLSSSARAVLDSAAVAGSVATSDLLTSISGQPLCGIEECLAAGMLIAGDDGSFAFRHELSRASIYDAISRPQRQFLHERVLRSLLESTGSANDFAVIAHHAEAANDRDAVLQYAPEAAKVAIALRTHREAAAQYSRALRFSQQMLPEPHARLLEAAAYELYLIGSLEPAIELQLKAVRIWNEIGNRLRAGDASRMASRFYWYAGRNAEAIEAAERALALLEPLPPGSELAMAQSNRSQLHMLASETEAAIDWGMRAISLATDLGDTEILAHALNNVGAARLHEEDWTGWAELEKSLELALELDHEEHASRAYTNLAWNAAHARDLKRARIYLEQGIEYTTDRDLDTSGRYMLSCRSLVRWLSGDWIGAETDAATVLARSNTTSISRINALVVQGAIRARRGETGADELLVEALELAELTGEVQRLRPVRMAMAEAAWLRGDLGGVAEAANAVLDLTLSNGSRWGKGEVFAWLKRAGTLAADDPRVELAALADPHRLTIQGDWAAAAALWEVLDCPFETAMALLDGDEAAIRNALGIFQRLGAKAAENVALRRLRDTGARGIPRGPRPATRANPANLTSREMDVLPFLLGPARNAEIADCLFLSAKTLEHHISRIYSKLGIGSRGEVAPALVRLGIELDSTMNRAAD